MSLSEKLIIASKKGNAREVRKLLGRGALFTKDQFGNTALHEAAWNGNKDIVKSLLGGFCFVDSINHTGFTSLHLASQNGHAKVVRTLLKWRADPSLLNQHGETALHLVAKYNHPGVISAFGAFKISMDFRGKDGNTALHISAKLGNSEVMKSLLQFGADPTLANMNGLRAMDFAEAANYKECTKLIKAALLKWKPPATSASLNNYTDGLIPMTKKRAGTYGCHSSAAKTASKVHLGLKTKGGKQYSFAKEKRHKSGYFSEDDSYRSQAPSHSYFVSTQEVPNGFSYGASPGVCQAEPNLQLQSRCSASPAQSKSASIDQLLSEMEREYYGPGYRPSPPPVDDPKGLITPYAEIHQLGASQDVKTSLSQDTPPQQPRPNMQALRSLSQDDRINYDFLKPTSAKEHYDNLKLSHSLAVASPAHFSQRSSNNNNTSSGSYTRVSHGNGSRVAAEKNKVSASRRNKSPSISPHHPHSPATPFTRNPTRQELLRSAGGEDMDTYVYMAPLGNFPDAAEEGSHYVRGGGIEVELEQLEFEGEERLKDPSEVSSSESGSRNSKKAVICNSPLEADRKHEPDISMEPVKGILAQTSLTESADKSHLEQYLQEELETMRQAFQIRLGQLEKRYQRQLLFEQQKQRHRTANPSSSSSALPSEGVVRRKRRPHVTGNTNLSERRNSWHSYISSEQELDKLAQPDSEFCGSSLGIDSDHSVEGSDVEVWREEEEEEGRGKGAGTTAKKNVRITDPTSSPESNLNESMSDQGNEGGRREGEGHLYSTPNNKPKVGLKGGDKSWRDNLMERNTQDVPKLSPISKDLDTEGTAIDEGAKDLIQDKMDEYRAKMMQYFQEKSEAQICVIEEKYRTQMDEVRRKYSEEASEKMSHLTTRIKDLENRLEVQTLV